MAMCALNTVKGMKLNMKLELASSNDIDNIILLIKKRINWMNEKNIKQWNTTNYLDFYNNEYFTSKVENNELYVIKHSEKILGAVVLLSNDPGWNDNNKAIYVHNLVSDIESKNIGKTILINVEKIAKQKNISFIRLDCQIDNIRLNEYYEDLGYKIVGTCNEGKYKGNKREKKI